VSIHVSSQRLEWVIENLTDSKNTEVLEWFKLMKHVSEIEEKVTIAISRKDREEFRKKPGEY
jgi:hypothetical protein